MIIRGHDINHKLTRVVKSVGDNLHYANLFESKKMDEGKNLIELKRPISAADAKYIYDNATYVATCSQILAEDTLLNGITLTPTNTDDETMKDQVEAINKLLDTQTQELYNLAVDFNYSGFAAVEIVTTKDGGFKIKQMPSHSLTVVQVTVDNQKYYLLRQRINSETTYYKIVGEEYPKNFTYNNQNLNSAMLLGGDNFYLFYSEPKYMSIRSKIFTEIAIQSKNYNKISKGNIANGVLHFNLAPQLGIPQTYDEEGNPVRLPSEEEVIDEELRGADSGVAVVYTRSENPISIDYVNIEAQNYDYLAQQQKGCEEAVLNVYRVPIQRLMIQTSEAMNSHQSETIFEIYTLALIQEQKKYQEFIKELIYFLYEVNVDVELGVPQFSDNRETELNILKLAWENGGLNLKQYITGLSRVLEVVNLEDYDFTVNQDIWDYRQVPGLYELMDPTSQEELDRIEEALNDYQTL